MSRPDDQQRLGSRSTTKERWDRLIAWLKTKGMNLSGSDGSTFPVECRPSQGRVYRDLCYLAVTLTCIPRSWQWAFCNAAHPREYIDQVFHEPYLNVPARDSCLISAS